MTGRSAPRVRERAVTDPELPLAVGSGVTALELSTDGGVGNAALTGASLRASELSALFGLQ